MMIDIKEAQLDGAYKLIVAGEVDASSSIHLDNALSKALGEYKRILIDLSDLEYISSAGLGVFISYIDEIRAQGIELVLFGLKEKVQQVFQILGIHDLLTIEETEADALKHLNDA
ncbi:MAG: STAS domain-containing protein [Bacteroidota bacterium]